jgi:hypothetical protein
MTPGTALRLLTDPDIYATITFEETLRTDNV